MLSINMTYKQGLFAFCLSVFLAFSPQVTIAQESAGGSVRLEFLARMHADLNDFQQEFQRLARGLGSTPEGRRALKLADLSVRIQREMDFINSMVLVMSQIGDKEDATRAGNIVRRSMSESLLQLKMYQVIIQQQKMSTNEPKLKPKIDELDAFLDMAQEGSMLIHDNM